MSTLPFRRNQPGDKGPEFRGNFAEQIRKEAALSGEAQDQLVVELAREVDRQEELFVNSSGASPAVKSQISERRSSTLCRIAEQLETRAKRRDQQSVAKISMTVMLVMRDVMRERRIEADQISQIIEETVRRIESGAIAG